jgi:hypothetical protein
MEADALNVRFHEVFFGLFRIYKFHVYPFLNILRLIHISFCADEGDEASRLFDGKLPSIDRQGEVL